MKPITIGLVAVAVFVGGLIVGSGSLASASPPAQEQPRIEPVARTSMATYGWVYPVTSIDAYNKTLDNISKINRRDSGEQARDDKRFLEDTHYCYERDTDPIVERWNRQRALNAATDAGWVIHGFDGDAVLIRHAKITCNNGSRAWGK